MRRVRLLPLVWLLLAPALAGAAAPAVPAAGLKAEGERRWHDALAIYQRVLRREPERADLWLRVADIQTALRQPDEALVALGEAARLQPQDAALQMRLSQAHAVSNQPGAALAAATDALALKPGDHDYLRAQAELAMWSGDLAVAESAWRALAVSGAPEAQRGLARVLLRRGFLDEAVRQYESYCRRPDADAAALLEHADAELFRGNYAAAERLLEEFRARAGDTEAYRRHRAALLADAGRPRAALSALAPMLTAADGDYDLQLSRTKALNAGHEFDQAERQVGLLEQLGPQRPETRGAALLVRTPGRSTFAGSMHYYTDSIPLPVLHLRLRGQTARWGNARLSLEANDWALQTDAGSGYETPAGDDRESVQDAWLRLDYQAWPALALSAGVGGARYPDSASRLLGHAGLRLWPADTLAIALGHQRRPVAVSPRAAALAVQRDENRLDLIWQPGLRSTVELAAAADRYSDGNHRYEAILAPRVAVMRRARHNLDLGVSAQWLRFDHAYSNGYYAPENVQRYLGVAYYYWKGGEDRGVSVVLGAGPERDRALDANYRLGGSLYTEAVFGIYADWQLKTYAAYGSRVDGTPDAASAGFELMRRF